MVKFMIPVFGLAALTLAAPAPSPATNMEARDDAFSFQAWIDEIVANPEAEHMSPEDAYKAAQKSTRSGESVSPLANYHMLTANSRRVQRPERLVQA